MTSLKLLIGGSLLAAVALFAGSCNTNPGKDCNTDGTCPTINLCDTCKTPATCGTCTTTPQCSTCNTNPNNPPTFTCDISTNGVSGTYSPFVGKVMKAWIYEDPNTTIAKKYIVVHAQSHDAVANINTQICISIALAKTSTGVGTYPMSSGSTTAALAYLPQTGTPYSTYVNNLGTGTYAISEVNTTDSTIAGTFGTATAAIQPLPAWNPSSTTPISIKNGKFSKIKFTNWFKAANSFSASVGGTAWTLDGVVRAHPGGPPKWAHKLIIEAPFVLNAGQKQKLVLQMPLNAASGASYPFGLSSTGGGITGDYNIQFTDAAGLAYSLKTGATSALTNVSHDLKLRKMSSSGTSIAVTSGTTTKNITNCNYNVNY